MKPPPRKSKYLEEMEELQRKMHRAIFFAVLLFFFVVAVGVYFVVIGWKADRAQEQKQEQRYQQEQKIETEKQKAELRAELNRLVLGTRIEFNEGTEIKRVIFPPGSRYEYVDGQVRQKTK